MAKCEKCRKIITEYVGSQNVDSNEFVGVKLILDFSVYVFFPLAK